jgi:hypothetical protein
MSFKLSKKEAITLAKAGEKIGKKAGLQQSKKNHK